MADKVVDAATVDAGGTFTALEVEDEAAWLTTACAQPGKGHLTFLGWCVEEARCAFRLLAELNSLLHGAQ